MTKRGVRIMAKILMLDIDKCIKNFARALMIVGFVILIHFASKNPPLEICGFVMLSFGILTKMFFEFKERFTPKER